MRINNSSVWIFLIPFALAILPGPVQGASVETRLKTLEQQLKDVLDSDRHNKQRLAEALATFDQVKEDMTDLRGEIEKIGHEAQTDTQQRSQQLQKMERTLSRMEERLADMEMAIKDLSEFRGEKSVSAKKAQAKVLYEEAFSELTQKKYKTAYRLFNQYQKKYPKSKLADNAQYWKAECLYAQRDYEKAILEFQKVIKRYPKGNKVAAAILKQGLAFMQLKAYADAKAFFEKVMAEHPKTKEAVRAKEKLTEVKKLIETSTGKK